MNPYQWWCDLWKAIGLGEWVQQVFPTICPPTLTEREKWIKAGDGLVEALQTYQETS